MKIVQVQHRDSNDKYIFEVPKEMDLKKEDAVKPAENKFSFAICTSNSMEVSDEALELIMGGKKVPAKIQGKYVLEDFSVERLFQESSAKKRWETINNEEDLNNLYDAFVGECKTHGLCCECRFHILHTNCFYQYLREEVEVEAENEK